MAELLRDVAILNTKYEQSVCFVQLTALALQRVVCFRAWEHPQSIFAVPSTLDHASVLQLVLALEGRGWTWRKLPRKVPSRLLLAYKPGDDQVWYTAGITVTPEYLRCLLNADKLCAAGLKCIPHYFPQKAALRYQALLDGDLNVARDAASKRWRSDAVEVEVGAARPSRNKRAREGLEGIVEPLVHPADPQGCVYPDDADRSQSSQAGDSGEESGAGSDCEACETRLEDLSDNNPKVARHHGNLYGSV